MVVTRYRVVTAPTHDLWVVVRSLPGRYRVVTRSLPGRGRPDPLFVGRYEGRYRLVKTHPVYGL